MTITHTDASEALASYLGAQEAKISERAAEHRERLHAAREALPGLKEAAEEAEADLDAARADASDWSQPAPKRGDLTLAKAVEAHTVAELRLSKASAEVASLGKRIPCTDKRLAEIVAAVLADQLPGIPVIGTWAGVNVHDLGGLPAVCVVVSAKAATESPEGLSATLEVVQRRTSVYAPLTGSMASDWLQEAGVRHRPIMGSDMGYHGEAVTRFPLTVGPVQLDENGQVIRPEPTPEELRRAERQAEADAFDQMMRSREEHQRAELAAAAEAANTRQLRS